MTYQVADYYKEAYCHKACLLTLWLDIAAEVWTAVDLGGDYYQFLEQSGTLAVAIADSSGKSVAGAIHAALFKGQLDAYGQQGRLQNPASMLNSLNQLLCKSGTDDAIAFVMVHLTCLPMNYI